MARLSSYFRYSLVVPEAVPILQSWLDGSFDFSLRSICALEWELGERLWDDGAG